MLSRIPALTLAVVVGIGIGAFAFSRTAPDDLPSEPLSTELKNSITGRLIGGESSELDPAQVAQVVESLVQILDEEISERRVLAEQLEELRSEMTDLQQNLRARVDAAYAAERRNNNSERSSQRGDARQEERLAKSGLTSQQFETIRRREAIATMQRIELDDQARREGWVDSPRYYEAFNELEGDSNSIRAEIGDEAYDRYLFASGRPNRIAVGTVIPTSPAERAGFQVGDVVMSYGGEKVYSTEQLTNLRSSGDSGALVAVDIIRDGQPIQITMPRGPMGIVTRSNVIDPGATGGG